MHQETDVDLTLTVREIAAKYPATVPVFHGFGFDTCCGGAVSIGEASRREGVNATDVVSALRAALHVVE
ncbi:MAG: DUF542 domain-containing protein [Gemmatimonadaceae bacterium]|nr:DUF542 domain-containing protein [Gemmatimonadaceae bacterium]